MSRNLFLIPLWGRPAIARICLENLIHFGQEVLCIVSNYNDAALCANLGVNHCTFSNDWLGAKWNYGLSVAREMEWDNIVTLGSDDLIKESLFDFYKDESDILIMDKIQFIEVDTSRSILLPRARVGAGRRISRAVIEKCNYKLWSDQRNKSLDMDSNGTMNRAGYACIQKTTGPHIVGLKSDVNIWSFDYLCNRGAISISTEDALAGLPKSTIESVRKLLLQNSAEKINFV